MPENRELLLEVEVHSPVENRHLVQIVGIVKNGQVQRHLDDLMSQIFQRANVFAVAHAVSAVETTARTRNDVCDFHNSPLRLPQGESKNALFHAIHLYI